MTPPIAPDRRAVLGLIAAAGLAACSPTVQLGGAPGAGFAGPRFAGERFITYDGAPLGLTTWNATTAEPWAVIVGLHGMNSYAPSCRLAAPFWAQHGLTPYAYDQRGFGRSPHRGVWAPTEVMC